MREMTWPSKPKLHTIWGCIGNVCPSCGNSCALLDERGRRCAVDSRSWSYMEEAGREDGQGTVCTDGNGNERKLWGRGIRGAGRGRRI